MALVRIGLGSNVGDASANVERAFDGLAAIATLVARSSLYRTKPWGVLEQPDFINAAALLETGLEPEALLFALKSLEAELGRIPTSRWGPRVIDLDILAYDGLLVDLPHLVIPHPRLRERAFVLAPLAEIDPGYEAAWDALPPEAKAEVERLDRPKDDGL